MIKSADVWPQWPQSELSENKRISRHKNPVGPLSLTGVLGQTSSVAFHLSWLHLICLPIYRGNQKRKLAEGIYFPGSYPCKFLKAFSALTFVKRRFWRCEFASNLCESQVVTHVWGGFHWPAKYYSDQVITETVHRTYYVLKATYLIPNRWSQCEDCGRPHFLLCKIPFPVWQNWLAVTAHSDVLRLHLYS